MWYKQNTRDREKDMQRGRGTRESRSRDFFVKWMRGGRVSYNTTVHQHFQLLTMRIYIYIYHRGRLSV